MQYTVVHLHIARGLIINVCEVSVMMLTDAAAAFFLLGRGLLEIQGPAETHDNLAKQF